MSQPGLMSGIVGWVGRDFEITLLYTYRRVFCTSPNKVILGHGDADD